MPLNLVVCGFLGSGKTTLIRHVVREVLAPRRIVVVENESGRETVDGAYLRDGGVKVVDLRAGCVCCTLRGELAGTMARICADYSPDCIILEPSGLGDLADLLRIPGFEPDGVVMLVDVARFDMLLALNRDHYLRQFRLSPVIVLTHTDRAVRRLVDRVRDELERINPRALVVERGDALDAGWWLGTVPERYARFRTFFPVSSARGPRFVSETFPIVGTVVRPGRLEALFSRLADRALRPVRAKGCLPGETGWTKVDWLDSGDPECAPLAEAPACGGFLTCWWVDDGRGETIIEDVRELLNDRIDGTE